MTVMTKPTKEEPDFATKLLGGCIALSGAGVIGFMAGIIAAIYKGWVLSLLWEWFMVSQLGVPSISVPGAIGIVYIVSLVTYTLSFDKHDSKETAGMIAAILLGFFGVPTTLLISGYIVHLFM